MFLKQTHTGTKKHDNDIGMRGRIIEVKPHSSQWKIHKG